MQVLVQKFEQERRALERTAARLARRYQVPAGEDKPLLVACHAVLEPWMHGSISIITNRAEAGTTSVVPVWRVPQCQGLQAAAAVAPPDRVWSDAD